MFFKIDSVTKQYGNKYVLKNISFQVEKGDIVTIIGPSGVGKTTLLKIVAGLEKPTEGSIYFEHTPTIQHPVILVFQDFILFPQMTVYDNVAFGLRARKVERDEIERKVSSILGYFDLIEKSKSYPNSLSAGQKQRVAIARAMVVNPSVLLLDEPFAHLDKNLRLETADFIRSTQKEFGITTISVTHDLQEAFAMSDKIGIMLDGELIQYDTPENMYFNPNSFAVAKFIGPVNIIPKELCAYFGIDPRSYGKSNTVFARAEAISIERDEQGPGIVKDVCFIGVAILYRVDVFGKEFTIFNVSNVVEVGDRVRLKVVNFINNDGNS
jgi:putative spermidine/putrescine transport system ATP-binding protein